MVAGGGATGVGTMMVLGVASGAVVVGVGDVGSGGVVMNVVVVDELAVASG